EKLSIQLAIAIQQSQLYQQAQKELKERIFAQTKLKKLNEKLEFRVIERTKELHQSQEYLRQITENIDSVFWIKRSEDDQILYISQSYQRIWGYSCREISKPSQIFRFCLSRRFTASNGSFRNTNRG
ncbi:MAG: PAS domain S-box protein, partial [Sphaerospermopsis kisseleviana]